MSPLHFTLLVCLYLATVAPSKEQDITECTYNVRECADCKTIECLSESPEPGIVITISETCPEGTYCVDGGCTEVRPDRCIANTTTTSTTTTTAYTGERRAMVILKGEGVSGNVTLMQYDGGPVTIRGTISGLTKGKHGVHIHEKGNLTTGCNSTKSHGGPTDEVRHVDVLSNIFADDNGDTEVHIVNKQISLVGMASIVGRAVVVHSDADDLGRGGFSDSITTGHAGTPVACGVIGIQ